MTRELVCIICPRGCSLKVELDGKTVTGISGNNCKRGERYAQDECCNPRRTITTTVRCADGRRAAVKTDCPIPKEHMFECMKLINSVTVQLPVSVGDVILEDAFGSRVVATENVGIR